MAELDVIVDDESIDEIPLHLKFFFFFFSLLFVLKSFFIIRFLIH
jgi:hypothetical protein